ncbi:hypothetical protein AKO1_007320 [Acrasis kona]|uniref:Uncharacterized protein n=1 Tax=Acrasis kona TaxID=1008807 RepID=A0AAW2YTQ0_9EUKA
MAGVRTVIFALVAFAAIATCQLRVFSSAITPGAVVQGSSSTGFGVFLAHLNQSVAPDSFTYYLMHNVANVTSINLRAGNQTELGDVRLSLATVPANILQISTVTFTPPAIMYNNNMYIEINTTAGTAIRGTILFSNFPVSLLGRIGADQVPGGSTNNGAGLFLGSTDENNNIGFSIIHNITGASAITLNSPKDCSTNVAQSVAQLNNGAVGTVSSQAQAVRNQVANINANRAYLEVASSSGALRGNIIYYTNFNGNFNPACTAPSVTTASPTSTPSGTRTPSPTATPTATSSSSIVAPSMMFMTLITLLVLYL